ncbi:MAG TPA: hypothetical protein DCY20_10620 [Firmicutes bacterium]|nr:hypothetical protein [Bacillota bacterium]
MKHLKVASLVFFSFCFILGCFIFVTRMQLESTVFNEEKHINLQKEFNIYEGIKKEIDTRIQRALSEANIYVERNKDLITIDEIEAIIQQQTRDYIEVMKGNATEYTTIDTGYYIDKLGDALVDEGYDIELLNKKTVLFVNVHGILKEYVQVKNEDYVVADSTIVKVQEVIAFIYSDTGYWLSLGLMIVSLLGIVVSWKYKWQKIMIHLTGSLLGLGILLFSIFLFLYKVSLDVYKIDIGQKYTYVFAKAYYSLFYKLFKLGGGLIIYMLLLIALLLIIREVKSLMIKNS